MPALDALVGGGAIHIGDQNKLKPVGTLCGQALDKESTRYFAKPESFQHATCKVCRKIYFDESWSEPPVPEQTVASPPPEENQPQTNRPFGNLFGHLTAPVNEHKPKETTNGP